MNFLNIINYVALDLTQGDITNILKPIDDIIKLVVPALLALVGSVGAIWCIVLGVKFAKAEDPQEHEKAKKSLINAIIGFVLIFVLLIMLNLSLDVFIPWYQNYQITQ